MDGMEFISSSKTTHDCFHDIDSIIPRRQRAYHQHDGTGRREGWAIRPKKRAQITCDWSQPPSCQRQPTIKSKSGIPPGLTLSAKSIRRGSATALGYFSTNQRDMKVIFHATNAKGGGSFRGWETSTLENGRIITCKGGGPLYGPTAIPSTGTLNMASPVVTDKNPLPVGTVLMDGGRKESPMVGP